eukprot:350616_1
MGPMGVILLKVELQRLGHLRGKVGGDVGEEGRGPGRQHRHDLRDVAVRLAEGDIQIPSRRRLGGALIDGPPFIDGGFGQGGLMVLGAVEVFFLKGSLRQVDHLGGGDVHLAGVGSQ